MESKTSSGQILIECALGLATLTVLFSMLLEFNDPKLKKRNRFRSQPTMEEKIKNNQVTDFRSYRNGR